MLFIKRNRKKENYDETVINNSLKFAENELNWIIKGLDEDPSSLKLKILRIRAINAYSYIKVIEEKRGLE